MPNNRGGKALDLSEVTTYSIRDRASKFDPSQMARVPDVHKPLEQFFECLPKTLKARDLLEIAEHIVVAAAGGRKVVWMMGAHLIKCGLSPLVVRLMEQFGKPILGVSLATGASERTLYEVEGSDHKGVFFPSPERAVRALAHMCDYQDFLSRPG